MVLNLNPVVRLSSQIFTHEIQFLALPSRDFLGDSPMTDMFLKPFKVSSGDGSLPE